MQGPVSGRRFKRRVVRNVIVGVCLLLLAVGAIFGGRYYSSKIAAEKEQQQAAANEAVAARFIDSVSAKLQPSLDEINKLAASDSLRAAFQDVATLNDKEKALSQQIKDALQVRLFLPGQYSSDSESTSSISFATLDMLRQAETTAAVVPVELHNFGTDNAHLVVIRRVMDADNKKLIGLMYVGLAAAPYLKLNSQPQANEGYVELAQSVGGNSLVLDKVGTAGFRQGAPIEKHIAGTRLVIDYWPQGSAPAGTNTQSGGSNTLVLLIAGLLVLVVLVSGFIYLKGKRQTVAVTGDDDSVVYGGAIKAIMEGLHPGLEKLIPNLPKTKVKKQVVPLSKGMQGDDITRIAVADTVKKAAATPTPQKPVVKPGQNKPATPKPPAPEASPQAPVKNAAPKPAEKLAEKPAAEKTTTSNEVPAVIFRQYDIRGVVGKTLTPGLVTEIGKAIGTEAISRNQKNIAVGRDGRDSGPELCESLIKGLRATGCNVTDIGMVPTPVLYFATHHLETHSGVMLTGSHNGPEYNGLKIILGDDTLSGDAIQGLRQRVEKQDYVNGQGELQTADVVADYVRRATEDIPVALGSSYKIVIDCGNGIPGMVAPQIFKALGHDVIELYCDVDGKFPNHQPDPSQPGNLKDLIAKIKETDADLGFAFDGDGDRLGVVDSEGNILWPDRQMMLFARDVLERNQGASIIYDVKCSRSLKTVIEESGGVPLMWKTGHSLIKSKMKETEAPLAGEMSGHIFFKERWYGFDDAMYAGARLLEILTKTKTSPTAVFADLPGGVATPELRIPLAEKFHQKFMQALVKKASFPDAEITDIDGIRVDFPDRWGLLRPSNTTPCLIARFEANDEAGLEKIKGEFHSLIQSITPDLKLPF